MFITRKSQASGTERTLDLDVTQEQMDKFNAGEHVQKCFPHLSASDREFILTGTTQEEWNEIFPPEEEEEPWNIEDEQNFIGWDGSDDDFYDDAEEEEWWLREMGLF